jgi:hypothetical protein
MPRPKRSRVQRELDRSTIAELSLKGWSQPKIAQHLELSQSMINYELQKLRREWRESAAADMALERGRCLKKLDLIEGEAWGAWEESRGKKEVTTAQRLVKAGTPDGSRLQRREEQQFGNPAFLKTLLDCIKERSAILGLHPEEQKSAAGIQLSNDQFDAIASLMKETHADIATPPPVH